MNIVIPGPKKINKNDKNGNNNVTRTKERRKKTVGKL